MIEIAALRGIGEVLPGADLVALVSDALERDGRTLRSGDILVVTQKIVSKAEGRFVRLSDVEPGAEAHRLAEITGKAAPLIEMVLRESTEVVRAAPNVLVTRHRLGLVMANAGVDRSNLGPEGEDRVLLLPTDPDGSAERLASGLAARHGVRIAVVISDSFGRPWRHGVVCVGIGAAGLPALLDRRGEPDRDGRRLEVTQVALADMVATAAGLACGEGAEGVPAALIRGYPVAGAPRPASALVRPIAEDLFR